MSDFNSSNKIQTYGNKHSILRKFETIYCELMTHPRIKSVGSSRFRKNKIYRGNDLSLEYDEGHGYFQLKLYSKKWMQVFKIFPNKEGREYIRKNIEKKLN